MVKKITKTTWKQIGFVASLVAVPILQFLIFYVFINGSSILLAFKNSAGDFTLSNFKTLFDMFKLNNSPLTESLVNTLKFFALGLVMFPLSLLFSYFLYKKIFMYRYMQIVFFLPSIIAATVMVALYKNIMTEMIAPVVQKIFNLEHAPLFFTSTTYALKSIMAYMVWTGIANNMVILSGTMARIPAEVLESGKMDGVGFWREFVQLVIPLIWPTLSTLILMMFIGVFTGGGPILLFGTETPNKGHGTKTISYFIYEYTVERNESNLAAAVGVFFTVAGLPIIYGVKYLLGKLDANIEY